MDIEQVLSAVNPEIIEKFRLAIEIGKWPNGVTVTAEQRETCMQTIIAYEHRFTPEHERTGYVPPKKTPCDDDHTHDEVPVKWADS